MIHNSDVPSYAVVATLDTVPGTSGGEMALRQHIPYARQLLRSGHGVVMFDAATGSGKSKLLPSEIQLHLRGKLLALNPSTLDTKNVCTGASCKSCYRMGGRRQGGDRFSESRVVFATVGLVAKWYASGGSRDFRVYDGVFCDEMHLMESDPRYALLWELFMDISKTRQFLIVGASSTITSSMKARLDQVDVRWVRCHERPYPLERYIVTVATVRLLYEAMAYTAATLLKRGQTLLIFLPGKHEIEQVRDTLVSLGVNAQWVTPLHADLEEHEMQKAMDIVDHPKAILATSLAETSITLPQVDHVLDSGFSRFF